MTRTRRHSASIDLVDLTSDDDASSDGGSGGGSGGGAFIATTSASAAGRALVSSRRITPSPPPNERDIERAETPDLPAESRNVESPLASSESTASVVDDDSSPTTLARAAAVEAVPAAMEASSLLEYTQALGPMPAIMGAFDETVNAVQAVAANQEEEEQRKLSDSEARKLLAAEEKQDWKQTQRELDSLFDKQNENKYDGIPAFRRPDGFKDEISFFPYQQDGIRWMVHQETAEDRVAPFWKERILGCHAQNRWWYCTITQRMQKETPKSCKGAILADDMGLGKTLQSIGLILSNRPKEGEPSCTLIVAPVSVIANWDQQLTKFVKPDTLRVAVYHGPKRQQILTKVKRGELDVLLTSYETLTSDLAQFEEMQEEKEEKKMEAKKLKASKKTKRDLVRSAWDDDSDDDFDPSEESSDDEDDHYLPPSMLKKRKRAPTANRIWIFDLEFFRICLDEAHKIRNSKTSFFKSVMMIAAERKLCLTGTPFVNRPSDIHSLMAFLGAEPLSDKSIFVSQVVKPIMEAKEVGLSRIRIVVSHLALRRTKALVNSTIQLVPKEVILNHVEFPEGGFHGSTNEVLYETARAAFLSLLRAGSVFSNFYAFLTLVLRVRQSCCSGYLVPTEARDIAMEVHSQIQSGEVDISAVEGAELLKKLLDILKGNGDETEYDKECAVCYAELEEENACVLRSCQHVICESCLDQIQNQLCPLCRKPYQPSDMVKLADAQKAAKKKKEDKPKKKAAPPKVDHDGLEIPPKVQAILDGINEMAPDEKGVIFSQWTSFLDIIQAALERNGHTTTRIDGSMNAFERIQAMQDFESEDGPRFIMCSLHACGAGISLTRGNIVWLCDAWWNASIEAQAMDRVHRIGQVRPVKVIRLIMNDSLEQRMVELQVAKQCLGKGSLQKLTKEERKKARITALKDLFQVEEDLDQKWEGFFDDEEEDDGEDLRDFIVDDDNFE